MFIWIVSEVFKVTCAPKPNPECKAPHGLNLACKEPPGLQIRPDGRESAVAGEMEAHGLTWPLLAPHG